MQQFSSGKVRERVTFVLIYVTLFIYIHIIDKDNPDI